MKATWWIVMGLVTAVGATALATGGGGTGTATRPDRDRGKVSTGSGITPRRSPSASAPQNGRVGTLAQRGLRTWDQGARGFGYTTTEAAHAAAPAASSGGVIRSGKPTSYWASMATQLIREKGLPASYMHLPATELEKLFNAHVIDEVLYGAILDSRP